MAVELPAGIPRTLLTVLLLNANRAVPAEQLADAVWGDDRPGTALQSLRNHVLRLRKHMGPSAGARVQTASRGYLVAVQDGELDMQDFIEGCSLGRSALHAGDVRTARAAYADALALWRDDLSTETLLSPALVAQVEGLREQRLLALEDRLDADLRLGKGREIVAEVRALTKSHPLRELLHSQLMLALYRAGRQAEALAVFETLRKTLIGELGVEPTAAIQDLHIRILRADATLLVSPSTLVNPADSAVAARSGPLSVATSPTRTGQTVTPSQLPCDTRFFTGRTNELKVLLAVAHEATTEENKSGVVAITAINGMGGIGKSALAIHAAHRLRARFPDGQIFVDLRGHTDGIEPLTAADALDGLLRSLGVPPALIPMDVSERAALYRDRLADTRTLIVLDNATSSAQVRPLLPAGSGCLVIVTSRRRLTGLDDAHDITLDPLPQEDAAILLRRIAGPDRTPAEHPAIPGLLELLGHVPLAIRIAAARLRHRKSLRVEDVVDELSDEKRRLHFLTAEDRGLQLVFEASYMALLPDEQRTFRLLGQVPGPDFDSHAVANLLDTDVHWADRLLESLLDHNLLAEGVPGRYRFHDLVRLYARTLISTDPAEVATHDAALERLLGYYRHTAWSADRLVIRHPRPGGPRAGSEPAAAPVLRAPADALGWLRSERENLLAAASLAAIRDEKLYQIDLSTALAAFLHQDGPWAQAAVLHETSARLAEELGEPVDQANALSELGRIRYLTGDYPGARELFETALSIYRKSDERLGEANALSELGRVRYHKGERAEAAELFETALSIYRELDERLGEANALSELGRVHYLTGDFASVVELYKAALDAYQSLGQQHGEANALSELGRVRRLTGDYTGAAELLNRALAIFEDLGHRHGQANTMWDLGRVRHQIGDLAEAAALHGRALAIFQDLGHRLNTAYARKELGSVRLASGDLAGSAELLRQALAVFDDLDHVHGQANTLHLLGRVRHLAGDHAAASDLLERSLTAFRDVGDPQGETEVLNSKAALIADIFGPKEAMALYQEAACRARDLQCPLDEAMALEGAARCAASLGEVTTARAHLTQAVDLYERLGAAESRSAAAFLDELLSA